MCLKLSWLPGTALGGPVTLQGDKVVKDGRMGVAAVFSELSGYY